MVDFRKWLLALTFVALLLVLGSLARASLNDLSGDWVLLCATPVDPPGIEAADCILVRPILQNPAYLNGVMQLTEDLSDGNRFALVTRWQRQRPQPLVVFRI